MKTLSISLSDIIPVSDAPALKGSPMSADEFSAWILNAEQDATISLSEANEKWASKRKNLLKLAPGYNQ